MGRSVSRRAGAFLLSATLLASLAVVTAVPAVAKDVSCAGKVATIVGTNASERIVGTNGRDVIAARGGNDVVVGKGGGDIICGGAGRDTLRGNRGADKLFGGKGDDPLDGGLGRDLCDQGPGQAGKKNCELPGRGMVVAPTPEPEPTPTPKPEPTPTPTTLEGLCASTGGSYDEVYHPASEYPASTIQTCSTPTLAAAMFATFVDEYGALCLELHPTASGVNVSLDPQSVACAFYIL